jgi:hypothetical protein
MTRLGATQVVSFPRVGAFADGSAMGRRDHLRPAHPEGIEALRARCSAAEHAAVTAAAAASRAREELWLTREMCQQMLETTALEILELKRELQAHDRMFRARESDNRPHQVTMPAERDQDDEIPFDLIDAILATSPL